MREAAFAVSLEIKNGGINVRLRSKILSLITVGAVTAVSFSGIGNSTFNIWQNMTVSGANYRSRDVDPLKYTYEVIPLLEPFNEYFYVKTENPDSNYADVVYEDTEFSRVNGGYIFYSGTTDGGELTLQIHKDITKSEFNLEVYGTESPESTGYSPYRGMPVDYYSTPTGQNTYMVNGYFRWTDSNVKVTLPKLYDEVDYLINEYAKSSDFFGKMDEIQSGLSSICHYSGSYIRGEIYRMENANWCLHPAGHTDQIFYIYSPYSRKDNRSLLMSALYPYRYDSLGFPSLMGAISKRLNSNSSYEWDSYNHNTVNVTYNGETKSYGGQGRVEGQGISKDKLTKIFDFSKPIESLTLTEVNDILKGYAAADMVDDIPRDGQLTWKKIYDTVGDGAWVDMGGVYTYLYQKDEVDYLFSHTKRVVECRVKYDTYMELM